MGDNFCRSDEEWGKAAKALLAALHGDGTDKDLLAKVPLTEKQLGVVELRLGFFDGRQWSFGDIGTRYDISRQAARKLFLKAMNNLAKLL